MPLIFIIIVVVFLIYVFTTGAESSQKKQADNASKFYGTNASYEREVMNDFILQGYSFDEAYNKTAEYLMSFDPPIAPCIPKKAYLANSDFTGGKFRNDMSATEVERRYSSYVIEPWQYDNSITDTRRYILEKRGIEPTFDNLRYNVPRTPKQLDRLYDTAGYLAERMPKGTRFTYPGVGLCEVVDYDDNPAMQKGHYIAKPLEHPDQTIKIEVGDPSIRRWTS